MTIGLQASRSKEVVSFIDLPSSYKYSPFSVVVPGDYASEFVRFVHPKNGKSAVAKVIRREGTSFKVSRILADVIGLKAVQSAPLFIEKVY